MDSSAPGIRAIHYICAACLIFGFRYDFQILYNIAAGMMLGCAIGCLLVWRIDFLQIEHKIKLMQKENERQHEIIKAKIKESREKFSQRS